MCLPIRLVFNHGGPANNGCGPECHDERFKKESLPCGAPRSNACKQESANSYPYYVYIAAPCARHLSIMLDAAVERWYDVWYTYRTSDPRSFNVSSIKSEILHESVRALLEGYITWRLQWQFDAHTLFIRNRIDWVKAGYELPAEPFYDLDIAFNQEIETAITFYRSDAVRVRTPLKKQPKKGALLLKMFGAQQLPVED